MSEDSCAVTVVMKIRDINVIPKKAGNILTDIKVFLKRIKRRGLVRQRPNTPIQGEILHLYAFTDVAGYSVL